MSERKSYLIIEEDVFRRGRYIGRRICYAGEGSIDEWREKLRGKPQEYQYILTHIFIRPPFLNILRTSASEMFEYHTPRFEDDPLHFSASSIPYNEKTRKILRELANWQPENKKEKRKRKKQAEEK